MVSKRGPVNFETARGATESGRVIDGFTVTKAIIFARSQCALMLVEVVDVVVVC